MTTMGEALALATTDEARARLWADPESFGRDAGLSGADLAELVGAIRHGRRGLEQARQTQPVLKAAVDNDLGRPWPFAALTDDGLAEAAAQTEACSESLVRAKGVGAVVSADVVRRYRSWATALLGDATARAERSTTAPVHEAVADALVAARNLLSACDRHAEARD